MGNIVTSLENVGRHYKNYLSIVGHELGGTAEEVIDKNFQKLSIKIGENNVIIYPKNKALEDTIRIFNIKITDERPVLILSDLHPLDIQSLIEKNILDSTMVDALKIQLGNVHERDSIIRVLFELIEFIKSDNYSNIKWIKRKLIANEILKKINGVASIINLIPKP